MQIVDIGSNFGYPVANIFNPWKPNIINGISIRELQNNIDRIDLICLGGGADIAPAMYGHQNSYSRGIKVPSARDLFEREVWKIAQEHKVPIFGICRGAQMACVLSGGCLIQDVTGHTRNLWHTVTTNKGNQLPMSSYHHQLMYPFKIKHELIAWVPVLSERNYKYDATQFELGEIDKEPEIVYFPETNALGVQAHPEYEENPLEPSQVYTRELVAEYLLPDMGGSYK